ncbi:MAG: T9SS type A sorting domain-containing protein [Gemmatimonadota bacterium]|nr:MAG: T9SS type A sorting domain-containing protein [Gemmatimonadota bacterium]
MVRWSLVGIIMSLIITAGASDAQNTAGYQRINGLAVDYIGQGEPGLSPEIFAPGMISTDEAEFAGTFSPDFREYYFTRRPVTQAGTNTIYVTRKVDDEWTEPAIASFSGGYFDFEPHITPDGRRLYFGSMRPFEGDGPAIDMHQWYLEKTDTGWSEPQPLGSPFVERFVMYPSVTIDGTFYFTGEDGIYCSRYGDDGYEEPMQLGDEINFQPNTAHPYIAPDESYLIFDAQPRGEYLSDLFVSYKRSDGTWTQAIGMGEEINTSESQAIPSVSPDGKCFFFSRNADIYWMDAAVIERLKYEPSLRVDQNTGHAPLTVRFTTDFSNTPLPATSVAWDFDSDGTTDSQERNPTWTFEEPGLYTVILEVFSDTTSCQLSYDDYVWVFDGVSALRFDGEHSSVVCPASPSLNPTDALTIEAWINPTGWGEITTLGFGTIVDKERFALFLIDSHPAFNGHCLALQLSHENGANSFATTSEGSVVLDTWQHVAVTYNGTASQLSIYIDGLTQILSQTPLPSGSVSDNSTNDLVIGNDASGGLTFDGGIDEVRLWNVARTEEEITRTVNSHLLGDEPGLIGYWRMNEGHGTTISDHSGHGNDGTAVAVSWIQGFHLNPVSVDADEDGILDANDNCPDVYNPAQEDGDADGIGDSCDNCPTDQNSGQSDADSDGIGDACDSCTDTDDDGYGDPGYPANTCQEDICPEVYNPEQEEVGSGDINCDGGIDVLDILAVVNHILGNTLLAGSPLNRSDCNGDGGVDVLDALSIVNVILGIGECSPSFKPVVTPAVVRYCQSLKHYLRKEEFTRFMTLVKSPMLTPTGSSLSQNHPNPFNPETEITFDLTECSRVTLAVYNLLGEVVDVLVDSELDAGHHAIHWDGSAMTSGVYFYRLRTGEFTHIRKMTLIK